MLWVQVIHFVRHGEGFHNIGIVNEDAHLTEAGWRQAEALSRHIAGLKPALDIQVCDPPDDQSAPK
jgi:broad specificity phosphatase PhoE